jgi:hypothetical protein
MIESPFTFACKPGGNDPDVASAVGMDHHDHYGSIDLTDGDGPDLAIVPPIIRPGNDPPLEDKDGFLEADAMLHQVGAALLFVPLEHTANVLI